MFNQATIIGNLGASPDVRSTQSGDHVASFSVATSEAWMDKQTGDRRERTEWHRVVIFNTNLVAIAEQYLKKGDRVFVQGEMRTRKWKDNNGVEKYTTEIVLSRFGGTLRNLTARGNNADNNSDSGTDSGAGSGAGSNTGESAANDSSADTPEGSDTETTPASADTASGPATSQEEEVFF